jgi:hypothetical protein
MRKHGPFFCGVSHRRCHFPSPTSFPLLLVVVQRHIARALHDAAMQRILGLGVPPLTELALETAGC